MEKARALSGSLGPIRNRSKINKLEHGFIGSLCQISGTCSEIFRGRSGVAPAGRIIVKRLASGGILVLIARETGDQVYDSFANLGVLDAGKGLVEMQALGR